MVKRKADKMPADHIYDAIFYWLVGLLVIGLVANVFIRPMAEKWFIQADAPKAAAAAAAGDRSFGIGYGGFDAAAALAWAGVGVPIAWGVYMTLVTAAKIFQ